MTKIRVKIGGAEAEVEADPDDLAEAIELIPKLAAKLQGAGGQAASLAAQRTSPTGGQNDERGEAGREASWPWQQQHSQLPTIRVEKGDSLADVIGKFFSDPWGRERRKLLDVREALQSYGMNYPKQSVAVALLRLAKATKIRRFKAEDGEFVYTSASALVTPPPSTPFSATLDSSAENTPELVEDSVSELASGTNNSTI